MNEVMTDDGGLRLLNSRRRRRRRHCFRVLGAPAFGDVFR